MNTESIQLFVLAAESLNISAAGQAMGLAPSVASTRLAKLERTLGCDLFHRSTRKVSLSTEGSEFLPYAREILAQEQAARAALGLESETISGTLRVAASSTFAQLHLTPLLPEFLRAHPAIHLDLRLSDLPFDLIQGSFDLALRNSEIEDSSLRCRKLADDDRILCASPHYLKANGVPEHPDELAEHSLIGFREQKSRRLASSSGKEGIFDPRLARSRLTIDDGLTQKLATVAGCGISANSLWSVYRELQDGSLIRVLPRYDVKDRSALWLVYPKSNVLSAKVRAFIDFLIDRIGSNPPWLVNKSRQ
ncbi:MAG: LysR substrate-binding domain-containing protein [Pseudomonadota bacterium]